MNPEAVHELIDRPNNKGLKIMLQKIEHELLVIELFSYQAYFEPRNVPSGHHPCVYAKDNPAFTFTLDPDYQRMRLAIRRVNALREAISDQL